MILKLHILCCDVDFGEKDTDHPQLNIHYDLEQLNTSGL